METTMRTLVVMSWSGGKDSAVALHELLRLADYEVTGLMTTVFEEYRRISHHGVREALLDEQAAAIGIPLEKVYLPSRESGGCTNDPCGEYGEFHSFVFDGPIFARPLDVSVGRFYADLLLKQISASRGICGGTDTTCVILES
jgi:diphthamide synthase (EF-2-diphthine--ammonia ligase)